MMNHLLLPLAQLRQRKSFFVTFVFSFSSPDMHHVVDSTALSRVSDIFFITEQTANRNSKKSASSPLSVTPHFQQQNCIHVYLFHSLTLARCSGVIAPTHSPFATHLLTEQNSTSKVKEVSSLAACHTPQPETTTQNASSVGPMKDAEGSRYYFSVLPKLSATHPSTRKPAWTASRSRKWQLCTSFSC